MVVVVDFLHLCAFGDLGGAADASDGGDFVFAFFEKSFGYEFANLAAGLG